jgi:RNA polymerase sigma-70 factor (ECF subfamily)
VPDIKSVEMSREDRFRLLFDLHFHQVLGFAMRRSNRRVDAEDVVAEVFTTAWRRLDDVPAGHATKTWLYAVARRVLANQRRGAARRNRLIERLHREPDAPVDADPALGDGPMATAFAGLKAADREVLGLAYWEDLSPAEIAAVLGISTSTARVKVHRARKRLAEQLTVAGSSSEKRRNCEPQRR